MFSFSSQYALTQPLPSNPEYDRIIAEAQKSGKDPLEVAQEKKKNDDFIIDLDSYINNRNKQVAIARANNEKKIDEVAIADEERIGKKKEQLIKLTQVILTAMKSMESQGRFGHKQITDINRMYEQSILNEEKKLIRDAF